MTTSNFSLVPTPSDSAQTTSTLKEVDSPLSKASGSILERFETILKNYEATSEEIQAMKDELGDSLEASCYELLKEEKDLIVSDGEDYGLCTVDEWVEILNPTVRFDFNKYYLRDIKIRYCDAHPQDDYSEPEDNNEIEA